MDDIHTKDPAEAVDLLLDRALAEAPVISEARVVSEHDSLRRAWGSLCLFSGDSAEIREIILPNLEELAGIKEFEEFVVRVYDTLACAQVMAIFSTDTFTGVRVWHTESAIYTCGNSAFHR